MNDRIYYVTQCNSEELKRLKMLSRQIDKVDICIPVNKILSGPSRAIFNSFLTVLTKVALKERKRIELKVNAEDSGEDSNLSNKIRQVGHRLDFTGVTLTIVGNTIYSNEENNIQSIKVVQSGDK